MSKGGDTDSSNLKWAIGSGALTWDTCDFVIMAAVQTVSRPFKRWSHWRIAESRPARKGRTHAHAGRCGTA